MRRPHTEAIGGAFQRGRASITPPASPSKTSRPIQETLVAGNLSRRCQHGHLLKLSSASILLGATEVGLHPSFHIPRSHAISNPMSGAHVHSANPVVESCEASAAKIRRESAVGWRARPAGGGAKSNLGHQL